MSLFALRHLPNAISIARILTVPVLGWLAFAGHERAFAWLILAAGLSDILDGSLARRFGWQSRLGSLLDSIADVLLTIAAIIGLYQFHRGTLAPYVPVLAGVIGLWLVVHGAALLRYGRLAAFHTRLTQVGLFSFGLFVLSLFFYGLVPAFFYLVAALCFAAGIENLLLIALTPEWQPDQRGGLLARLRERRNAAPR